MKAGDFIITTAIHTTGCGKDYPVNSIGTLVTTVPDRDGELRVSFAKHMNGGYSYIPIDRVKLVSEERIEEAKAKFENAKAKFENAVL